MTLRARNFRAAIESLDPLGILKLALACLAVVWGLALARLSLLNAVLITVLALVAVGSLWEPLVGVGSALFLGPLWAWLRAEVPQIPPLIGQYVFFLAIAAWLARGLLRHSVYIPFPPLCLPLLIFMGVALWSLWDPADTWVGLWEWAKWGQILFMFLLVYDRFQRPGGVQRVAFLLMALVGVGLFQAGMGLWQSALRGTGPDHFAINERFYRAYGTFEQPNPYAGFLGMLGALLAGIVLASLWDYIPLMVRWLWDKLACFVGARADQPPTLRIPWYVWGSGVAGLVVAVALGASWSRGAWMGFGAAGLVMLTLLPKRSAWGIILVSAVIVTGVGLYSTGLLPASVANRMTGFLAYTRFEDVRGVGINDANYAVLERMAHWQSALDMWRANFWLGVGFGCYEPAYPEYRLINWPIALGHAHNYYLNLLAETGLLGLVAYLVFLGATYWQLWRALRQAQGWRRGLALGLMGAWTHLCVHSLVDNLLVNNIHFFVGIILALSAWLVSSPLSTAARCNRHLG